MTQAVILAGGFGTRLGSLTRATPKPLLPVAGRPFIDILIAELRRQGIDEILVVAGFMAHLLEAHFATDEKVIVVSEPEPLGTGGALRFAAPHLAPSFFFLNGDSLFDVNLNDLSAAAGHAVSTLALRQMSDVSRYGPAELDSEGRVVGFAERPTRSGPGLINAGVGFFSRDILGWISPDGAVSIERDIYPLLAKKGQLRGRVYERPFIDIGIPSDYALAQTEIPAMLTRGAVIFDRDGVLNEDIAYAHRQDQIRWIEGAHRAVKLVNDAGLLALVATNQAGVAHGYYQEHHVLDLHRWMVSEIRRSGGNIDGFAYCPYHPEGALEAYRRASEMRKPGPGMLIGLMKEHGVDPVRCVMVGDRETDMAAAASAGIEGIFYPGGDLSNIVGPVVSRLTAPSRNRE